MPNLTLADIKARKLTSYYKVVDFKSFEVIGRYKSLEDSIEDVKNYEKKNSLHDIVAHCYVVTDKGMKVKSYHTWIDKWIGK